MATTPPESPHPRPQSPLITLTTDFGTTDTYVAQMKGLIASISPDARVIDGTHGVPPQDIVAGAMALDAMVEWFPDGTIHVAVVDPGVGSDRAAVAVRTERFTLIGPDNGLFTLALERWPPTGIVRLADTNWHRVPTSPTFHGRDVFASVAAHHANGALFEALGEPVTTLVNLNIPRPEVTPKGLRAVILTADHFGNLITNLTRERYDAWLEETGAKSATFNLRRNKKVPIGWTFSDVAPGSLIGYFGSSGRLEVAVRDGSALELVGGTTKLRVLLKPA